jgi:hypothetical protein
VWFLRVVVFTPFFDDDLRLFQGVEDLAIKQFVTISSGLFRLIAIFDPPSTNYKAGPLKQGRPLIPSWLSITISPSPQPIHLHLTAPNLTVM